MNYDYGQFLGKAFEALFWGAVTAAVLSGAGIVGVLWWALG